MKSFILKAAVAAAALLSLTGLAAAQTSVTATTDLNIRSGPGPQYAPIGVIGSGQEATLDGCIRDSKWCMVQAGDVKGWSYSDYLVATFEAEPEPIIVTQAPPKAVPVVTYDDSEQEAATSGGAVSGAATGAVAGALVAGPVGAVAGAASGGTVGALTAPPPEPVRTYVRSNEPQPVYLEGEVVVGAGVPENVELRTVPDYDYDYVVINGQPVLVDPQTRRIVYIIRQ